MILYQDCSSHLDLSKNMATRGRGLFSLYIFIENLKKSSCQKPLDRFHYNLAKMFPWWPSTKIVQVIVIHQKTWPLGGGAHLSYISIENLKKSCQIFFFFFFFWFGFYGPFKNISLISSRSFIEGGRKPENPEKKQLTIRKQNLAFPHMTQARIEPQRWET